MIPNAQLPLRFDGPDAALHQVRLTGQIKAIYDVMRDGHWHTLGAIENDLRSMGIRAPQASISSQLRHLRKPRWGSHVIERQHIGGGLYVYRMVGE